MVAKSIDGNCGKSVFMKEFGSTYDGPVLYTDFTGITEPSEVNKRLLETISPLFPSPFPLFISMGK